TPTPKELSPSTPLPPPELPKTPWLAPRPKTPTLLLLIPTTPLLLSAVLSPTTPSLPELSAEIPRPSLTWACNPSIAVETKPCDGTTLKMKPFLNAPCLPGPGASSNPPCTWFVCPAVSSWPVCCAAIFMSSSVDSVQPFRKSNDEFAI